MTSAGKPMIVFFDDDAADGCDGAATGTAATAGTEDASEAAGTTAGSAGGVVTGTARATGNSGALLSNAPGDGNGVEAGAGLGPAGPRPGRGMLVVPGRAPPAPRAPAAPGAGICGMLNLPGAGMPRAIAVDAASPNTAHSASASPGSVTPALLGTAGGAAPAGRVPGRTASAGGGSGDGTRRRRTRWWRGWTRPGGATAR